MWRVCMYVTTNAVTHKPSHAAARDLVRWYARVRIAGALPHVVVRMTVTHEWPARIAYNPQITHRRTRRTATLHVVLMAT
jgi:hypothetical protein